MHFKKTSYAVAVLALCGPAAALAQSLPTPTSGTLEAWFKAPLGGQTISGTLSGSTCYIAGRSVNRVQFFLDNTALNTDTNMSDGMSCVLDTTKFPNGSHMLRAVAYDRSGRSYNERITVNIQNQSQANTPPTVSITSPGANQSVTGTLSYAANATDNAGVARVEFRLDGSLINSDTSAPYGGSISTLSPGTHTLTATAFDAAGLSATSSVTFSVPQPAASDPAASLPTPTSGTLEAWFKAPLGGQTVSGTLSGSTCYIAGRSVSRVQFFMDDTALNTDTNMSDGMSCVLDTTKFANGSHMLRAVAYDSSGRSYNERITINVQNSASTPPPAADTTVPTLSITSPTANQALSGNSLTYSASASDNVGVTKVEFRLDGTLIATDTTNSYGGTASNLAPGTHTLTATAYDAAGNSASKSVSFTVPQPATSEPSTSLPAPTSGPVEVWFKAPLGGQTVSGTLSGDKCYVKGTGTTRVQFFMNDTALNTDSNMSDGMSCVLDTTKFANGTHLLRAMAYDASGNSYHERISINVQNTTSGGGTTTPPPSDSTPPPTSSLPSTGVRAVPTFHSVGLYWSSPGGSAGCKVQYRAAGDSAWKQGYPMWYDSRNNECRGSLVHLNPGTNYEVQLGLQNQSSFARGIVTKTWSEQFPIARTVHVQPGQTLNITQGGSASTGYVLYTPAPGTSGVIDSQNAQDHNVRISAPHVIVRGFTLRGARTDAVRMYPGARDVVIENNNISNWGRARSGSLGVDMESAVRARCDSSFQLERTVIQNNVISNPRYGSNSWSSGHPEGPQGISYWNCGANHVFRYNRITSVSGKYYNDIIGGGSNFSSAGFPFADTDIYGNHLANSYDDAIEAEGANRNVRIWGNYMDDTYIAIASTATHVGPLYVFRNLYGRGGTFGKSGQKSGYGEGRRYFFHNTILQPSGGASAGIKGNTNEPMTNSISRNNVWHMRSSNSMAIGVIGGSANNFDFDMSNGNMTPYSGAQRNGIAATPTYASGHGPASGSGGYYQLSPSSRGYDAGERLPNFNDNFLGARPDMGAHETGSGQMRFGPR